LAASTSSVGEPRRQLQLDGQGGEVLLGAVVEVAFDPATLGVGRRHDAGPRGLELVRLSTHLFERGLKGGVEVHVVFGELGPLGFDETPLEEVRADTALDRVPGDHSDDDGGEEEEFVVDEDLEWRGLHPDRNDLVPAHDRYRSHRRIGEAKSQRRVGPGDDEKQPRVIQIAVRSVGDGDHRHDAESADRRQPTERGLCDGLEPPSERESEHRQGDRAEDGVADDPDRLRHVGDDVEIEDPEQGVEDDREHDGEPCEGQRLVEVIFREAGLEAVREPKAAKRQPRCSLLVGKPRHFPSLHVVVRYPDQIWCNTDASSRLHVSATRSP
jgi:hypothetical protein